MSTKTRQTSFQNYALNNIKQKYFISDSKRVSDLIALF